MLIIEEPIILTHNCGMRACSGIAIVEVKTNSLYGWQHSFVDNFSREWFSNVELSRLYPDGWLFRPEITFVVNYIAVDGANIAKLILQECKRMREQSMVAIRVKSYNRLSDNVPMIEIVFIESTPVKCTLSGFSLNRLVN